jgi:hypothetical protein
MAVVQSLNLISVAWLEGVADARFVVLREQLTVYGRKPRKRTPKRRDRLLCSALSGIWRVPVARSPSTSTASHGFRGMNATFGMAACDA